MKFLASFSSWTGIIGALLVALGLGFGFIVLLASSLGWIHYAENSWRDLSQRERLSLTRMNVVFAVINVIGVVRWIMT